MTAARAASASGVRPRRRRAAPWPRVVGALIVRDFDHRFRASPWLAAFQLLEGPALIAVFVAFRYFIFGRQPPYGTSLSLFYATGIAPLYAFLMTSRGVGTLTSGGREYALVSDVHLLAARYAIELIKAFSVVLIVQAALAAWGIPEAAPFAIERAAAGFAVLAAFGFGVGCANTAIASYFPFWITVYTFLSRAFLLLSGVVYVTDFLAVRAREWVVLNPLSHPITLYRTGFYPDYPSRTFDGAYMLAWMAGVLAVGGILFANRRRAPR